MTVCEKAASRLKILSHGGLSKVTLGAKQGQIDAGEQ
jgi:hypothetical protein